MKSKLVFWQPRYYNLLTKKKDKKMHVLKYSFFFFFFFENVLLLSISRNSLQTLRWWYKSLDDILLGNLTLSNCQKEILKYFRLTTMLVILKIKTLLISIRFLYQCHPPCNRQVGSHRVKFPWFMWYCIIYLHIIEPCLKVTIVIFYFYHSKKYF